MHRRRSILLSTHVSRHSSRSCYTYSSRFWEFCLVVRRNHCMARISFSRSYRHLCVTTHSLSCSGSLLVPVSPRFNVARAHARSFHMLAVSAPSHTSCTTLRCSTYRQEECESQHVSEAIRKRSIASVGILDQMVQGPWP